MRGIKQPCETVRSEFKNDMIGEFNHAGATDGNLLAVRVEY
jgi:hypothetical protein